MHAALLCINRGSIMSCVSPKASTQVETSIQTSDRFSRCRVD
jgi:hypothetical protein